MTVPSSKMNHKAHRADTKGTKILCVLCAFFVFSVVSDSSVEMCGVDMSGGKV
jgi:hypothetical protein